MKELLKDVGFLVLGVVVGYLALAGTWELAR